MAAAAAGNLQPPHPHGISRVSVLVGSHTVPLFPGRPIIDSTNSPWSGIVLEKQHHGAIEIPEHEHNDFCIHLQTGGPVAFDWRSEGREGNVRAASGDLILLTPGTRDSLLWHGPSQRIVTSINPSVVENAAAQLELRGGYSFANRWTFHDEQLGGLLTEMHREMSSGWPMGALYGDLLGMSLSIALLKKYASASAPLPVLKGGLSRSSLRRVLAYIEANLTRELRLEELAHVAGLSLFHFARSFRESTGHTPHRFLTTQRIERAKSLLRHPEWTIEQVASETGFAGGSQFARAFRQTTGTTPAIWRRLA